MIVSAVYVSIPAKHMFLQYGERYQIPGKLVVVKLSLDRISMLQKLL